MAVAVKKFFSVPATHSQHAELRQAFENEVFLMRKLQHNNLVRFFGAQCRDPGPLVIVMELMSGSLADL
jgi:serine/threonine protein kinase